MLRIGERVKIIHSELAPIKENGYTTDITAESILTIYKIRIDGNILVAEDKTYAWSPEWIEKIRQSKLDKFLSQLWWEKKWVR